MQEIVVKHSDYLKDIAGYLDLVHKITVRVLDDEDESRTIFTVGGLVKLCNCKEEEDDRWF